MKIARDVYIKRIQSLERNGRVKIVTGIRRCGKSFLLKEIYMPLLMSRGMLSDHIIYLAMDDSSNRRLLNPLELEKHIRSQIRDDQPYTVIIDEIQKVYPIKDPIFTDGKIVKAKEDDEDTIGFVDIVLGLLHIGNADIFISGSNSKFLSSEIVTEFRDRGDEIHVLPLNFSEYLPAVSALNREEALREYLLYGGMPVVLSKPDSIQKEEYLKNLFALTYNVDVLERNKIRKTQDFEELLRVMASSVGSFVNTQTIINTFQSKSKSKLALTTIDKWLRALEEAYILQKVSRIDLKGRNQIGAVYKYYFPDPGLRNALLNFLQMDEGHVMENVIYNELIYRGFSVNVGMQEKYARDKNGKMVRKQLEVDFAAEKGSRIYYIQSAWEVDTIEKQERERRSLAEIGDSFKKIIITRQGGPVRRDIYGITWIGLADFLLDENSLDL